MLKFDNYVNIGDYVEYTPKENNPRGFVIRATIAEDFDSSPLNCDCYTEAQVTEWLEDEWFFCGIIISVYKAGVCLSDHAASLWGLECNLGRDNSYLAEVVRELETEAIQEAETVLQKLID